MDEFGQTKPPIPPPPRTMQSEFIVRFIQALFIFCISVIYHTSHINNFSDILNFEFNNYFQDYHDLK